MNAVIEPKSQNITAFNKEVIKNCNSLLTNLTPKSREQNERLTMELKYFNYFDLSAKIESILTAIQIVAYDDRSEPKDKNSVIFDLAEIVKQIFPQNEMEFLDNLFLEPTKNKSDFININQL
jgi:hypothetical protein